MYRLNIERISDYSEEEMKKRNSGTFYPNERLNLDCKKVEQVLLVEVSEEELKVIKKSVIEIIK